MLKKNVICFLLLLFFACAQTAEIIEEEPVQIPEPAPKPEPELLIEKMVGTFEYEYSGGYRPILTLTLDYKYFLELNQCEKVWERRGEFEIKDSRIILKKAVHSAHWLKKDQPQYYVDGILEIESEDRFLVSGGFSIEFEGKSYGFCAPEDGGYFIRIL